VKKWDIVILRYPFTDLTATKARPALVISPDSSSAGDDAVFIAITGNTAGNGPHDVIFESSDPEYSTSGLLSDSAIKVDKIFTLHKSLAAKKIGVLGPLMQSKVKTRLIQFFELS
jgi:mRNA interferase MazF